MVIIILLLILVSIPVALNGPHIKDKLLNTIKHIKTSPGKKINNALKELAYGYNNTSKKENLLNFIILKNTSEIFNFRINNTKLLYFQLESSLILPFTIIKIKNISFKSKIEKYFKIKIKETFVFYDYKELPNVETKEYIFLLPEKIRNIINKIIEQSEMIYIKDKTIKLAFLPNEKKHNITFFNNLIDDIFKLYDMLDKKSNFTQNILNNINTDSNPEIRQTNIEAFYYICKDREKVKKVLFMSLKDKLWQPALTAAKLLGDEGQDYILDFLNHPVLFVKIEAINSLKKLNTIARNIVIKLLINKEPIDFKTGILRMLTKLRDIQNYKEIYVYLESIDNFDLYNNDFCFALMEYLKMCRQLSAVGILNKIKSHPNKRVSLEAGRTIKDLKKKHNNNVDGWLSMSDNPTTAGSLSLHNLEGGELSIKKDV